MEDVTQHFACRKAEEVFTSGQLVQAKVGIYDRRRLVVSNHFLLLGSWLYLRRFIKKNTRPVVDRYQWSFLHREEISCNTVYIAGCTFRHFLDEPQFEVRRRSSHYLILYGGWRKLHLIKYKALLRQASGEYLSNNLTWRIAELLGWFSFSFLIVIVRTSIC